MANSKFFQVLSTLFDTTIALKSPKSDHIKYFNIDKISNKDLSTNRSRMRRSGISGDYDYAGATMGRNELYQDYEMMDQDSILHGALDIYAEECLTGDTIIPLLDGRKIPIEELHNQKYKDFWVYSLDSKLDDFEPATCSHVAYNGKKPVYQITLDDGSKFKSTENHQWVMADGNILKTNELTSGDGLKAFEIGFIDSNNHKIVDIEYYGIEDVYDLVNVGENHVYALETNDNSKLFTHNCTLKNELGEIVRIKTENDELYNSLENFLYDILQVDHNLWWWTRSLTKYGNFYLKLDITEKIGITNVIPFDVYSMERLEDPIQNKVKFKYDQTDNIHDKREYEQFEVAHFRLLNDGNFLPYGRSMLEGARKTWKSLTLMEDAMLLHRIMRSPEKRIFKIDVGSIPPDEVDSYMDTIAEQMKKIPYIDPNTGEYNLKFNLMNMMEDFYLPVRGDHSGTEIDTLSGMDFEGIEDIEYLRNRMMAGLKIPQAYLGYEEALNSKNTLAAEDVRFANTIQRIQKALESELTKMCIIHLYAKGFKTKDILDFTIQLTTNSTIAELEKIEVLSEKIDLAETIVDSKLFSREWIYKNLFHMTDEEIDDEEYNILLDSDLHWKYEEIESEGLDAMENKPNPPQKQSGSDLVYDDEEEDKEASDDTSITKAKKIDKLRKTKPTDNLQRKTTRNTNIRDNTDYKFKKKIIESINLDKDKNI